MIFQNVRHALVLSSAAASYTSFEIDCSAGKVVEHHGAGRGPGVEADDRPESRCSPSRTTAYWLPMMRLKSPSLLKMKSAIVVIATDDAIDGK